MYAPHAHAHRSEGMGAATHPARRCRARTTGARWATTWRRCYDRWASRARWGWGIVAAGMRWRTWRCVSLPSRFPAVSLSVKRLAARGQSTAWRDRAKRCAPNKTPAGVPWRAIGRAASSGPSDGPTAPILSHNDRAAATGRGQAARRFLRRCRAARAARLPAALRLLPPAGADGLLYARSAPCCGGGAGRRPRRRDGAMALYGHRRPHRASRLWRRRRSSRRRTRRTRRTRRRRPRGCPWSSGPRWRRRRRRGWRRRRRRTSGVT